MPQNYKLAIGAVIVIVAGILLLKSPQKKDGLDEIPLDISQSEQVVTSAPKRTKTKQADVSTDVSSQVDTRSYAELILAFQGRTLQFGNNCVVRMSDQVYKIGSEIFLDNRTNKNVSIKIGSEVYELPSYGYKLARLNTEGQFRVDCGDYKNVATVTVQK